MNKQDVTGAFLRNMLNPVLRQFECAATIVHHTPKPRVGADRRSYAGNEFSYSGSGSAELANWPRAIIALNEIADGKYELRVPKRGWRLRWTTDDGERVTLKTIAHAREPGMICWREVASESREEQTAESVVAKILAKVPPGSRVRKSDAKLWGKDIGCSRDALRNGIEAAIVAGHLREDDEKQGRTRVTWIVRVNAVATQTKAEDADDF